jgi:hypothetical protein
MSYEVKDKIYQNRWVLGGRVKFSNQRAIVEDGDINYFKGLPQDFEVGAHTLNSNVVTPEPVIDENIPAGTLGVSRPKMTDEVGAETPSEKLAQKISQTENKPEEVNPAPIPVETPNVNPKKTRKSKK